VVVVVELLVVGIVGVAAGLVGGFGVGRRTRSKAVASTAAPRARAALVPAAAAGTTGELWELVPLDGTSCDLVDDLDRRFAEFLAADPQAQPAREWLLGR
jgi:hypothetical protein